MCRKVDEGSRALLRCNANKLAINLQLTVQCARGAIQNDDHGSGTEQYVDEGQVFDQLQESWKVAESLTNGKHCSKRNAYRPTAEL